MPQPIECKSPAELDAMRRGGRILARVLRAVGKEIREGANGRELDRMARELIEQAGARPAFLGYEGYPATLCVSINEQVVHGIPCKKAFRAGDLVSIDCGLLYEGFFSDAALTVGIEPIRPVDALLIEVTRHALERGIAASQPGARLGDIGAAIQSAAAPHNFSVVREYTGHGIGRKLHEPPKIPNYGQPGTGMRIQAGMVLALEPMINEGTWKTLLTADQWTVVTADGRKSCHFEHTVAITENGPEILTLDRPVGEAVESLFKGDRPPESPRA